MTPSHKKISTRDTLAVLRDDLRTANKRVAYTSGVFDLLHSGHVEYLEKAKALADVLIVGINSDASVRKNKGPSRPVVSEAERARVLAGLAAVDFVFVFDEQNNNSNITALQPDFYVKAADYSKTNLSSAPLVESYGGRVELIPLVAGKSSTTLIETAAERLLYGCIELPTSTAKPVAFLDRDGTLNESVEYLGEPEKMKLLPGVVEGLKQLNELGYLTVLVTNQPGIGMGYFSREDFYRVNRVLLKAASAAGAKIHKIYFCPHSHADSCSCRKPSTGMLERAFAELKVDKSRSVVIGDTTLDIKLAENAGLKSILVQTGMAGKDGNFSCTPTHVAQDFRAAVEILAGSK